MAVKNLETGEVFTEASSLLLRKDGKRYSKWEEKNGAQMCYYWIEERWEEYFSKAKVVILEKQMIKYSEQHFYRSPQQFERACLYVEGCFRSIFFTKQMLLQGPVIVCMSPLWWKRAVGIQIGQHKEYLSQKDVYLINKGRSRELFYRLKKQGDEEINKLKIDITTDEIESFFLLRALLSNLETKIKEGSKTSHHMKVTKKSKYFKNVQNPPITDNVQGRPRKKSKKTANSTTASD